MERNNLKKITGSRWFLPVVCAVSFVFGWWVSQHHHLRTLGRR